MNRKRGGTKYCPGSLFDEIEKLKSEEGLLKDCEAINQIVRYSRLGRDARRRGVL